MCERAPEVDCWSSVANIHTSIVASVVRAYTDLIYSSFATL